MFLLKLSLGELKIDLWNRIELVRVVIILAWRMKGQSRKDTLDKEKVEIFEVHHYSTSLPASRFLRVRLGLFALMIFHQDFFWYLITTSYLSWRKPWEELGLFWFYFSCFFESMTIIRLAFFSCPERSLYSVLILLCYKWGIVDIIAQDGWLFDSVFPAEFSHFFYGTFHPPSKSFKRVAVETVLARKFSKNL